MQKNLQRNLQNDSANLRLSSPDVDGVSRPSITPYLPAAVMRPVFSCVEKSGIL